MPALANVVAGRGPAFETLQGRNPRWEFREGRSVLDGDLGIKDGNAPGRREGREQGSTALVSVTVRRGGQQPRRRVGVLCEGFRMPALANVVAGRGPAFETLQGRNPRWEFRESRSVLYGDLGIKDGNAPGRREG